MSLTTIKINGAKFYAYHGVYDWEKQHGTTFEADIEMLCDLSELADTDDLTKTINYLEVYNLVKKVFESEKYNLIETANLKICKAVLDNFEPVKTVTVKIRKPGAPLGIIDGVEIINTISRQ